MKGYTPGPWHINGYDSETGVPATISGAGGEPILSIQRLNPDAEANARLIAAAPDLLQALKACLNYMENTESSFGITLDSADKARAAIAKAIAKAEIRK